MNLVWNRFLMGQTIIKKEELEYIILLLFNKKWGLKLHQKEKLFGCGIKPQITFNFYSKFKNDITRKLL